MKKALYAGSFDPPNVGHVDVIQRSSHLFETLFVGIAKNSTKIKSFWTVEQRVTALTEALKAFKNVRVVIIDGLTSQFAKDNQIDVLIRSLRNSQDFSYENEIAFSNLQISGIETLFIPASPNYSAISSSIIREIALAGGDVSSFLPKK